MFVFILFAIAILLTALKWRAVIPVLQNTGKMLLVSAIYLVFLGKIIKSVLLDRSV
ncbi:hypothetical protein [Alteromonas gilva]|uniref:Uncharacterized protein n=1 Tax=Alteromonas gilva TaxID=2987522 RepID=A0ABT5KWT9_9ALTE|nr:hypothetical protein [Alteromonas gilva]MDC8829234.1 hypothetical protein [Alteromonas gilva]